MRVTLNLMRNTALNSRLEVTMLLQFQGYAIFQNFTDVVTITTTGRGVKVVTNPASGEVVIGDKAK